MSKFGFEEMQAIQKELRARYDPKWGALSPERGRETLLWAMIEAGEIADVIKKQGDKAIMEDEETRRHFIEEFCDTLMYCNDLMLCYSITPDEVEREYRKKHEKNMKRW